MNKNVGLGGKAPMRQYQGASRSAGKGRLHGSDSIMLRHILRFVDVAFQEVGLRVVFLGHTFEARCNELAWAAPASDFTWGSEGWLERYQVAWKSMT